MTMTIAWLAETEPLWLFAILSAELLVGCATFAILVKEYIYDLEKDLKKPVRRTSKRKVIVRVEDGQAQIIEQPKDVELVIENK